jgi:hypothetical protein
LPQDDRKGTGRISPFRKTPNSILKQKKRKKRKKKQKQKQQQKKKRRKKKKIGNSNIIK